MADGESTVVLNFARAHEVLMKVRSFFYAHRNSDVECGSVLSLERSLFELTCKVSTKQLSVYTVKVIKFFMSIVFNGFPQLLFSHSHWFCFSKMMHLGFTVCNVSEIKVKQV